MTTPAPEATPNQPAAPEAQATEQQPNRVDWSTVPEAFKFLENIVSDANKEAARYRTERNELRDRLANAKTPEEYAALQKENEELRVNALRREAARAHNVPEELMDFLTATDEAGLEAQASKLGRAKDAPTPPTPTPLPPSGGSTPLTHPSSDTSGKDEYARWKERNKSL